MRFGRAVCLLVLATAAAGTDAGVLDDRPLRQYMHEAWTTRDGLPQNAILNSAQTSDGYLWFGTHDGLSRFDGVRFHTFGRPNPVIRRGSIWSTLARRRGDLIFGDTGVVGRTVGATRVEVLFEEFSEAPLEVSALLEQEDGSILTGTRNVGLHLWDGGVVRPVLPERLGKSKIQALARTDDGTVWVGTQAQGLVALKDETAIPCRPCDSLPRGSILALTPARGGGIWVGGSFGLARIERDGSVRNEGVFGETVTAALETDTSLWVGTQGGLLRVREGRVERDPELQGRRVLNLLMDREGSLWVGTEDSGLHRLRAAPVWTLGSPDGLGRRSSGAVFADDWLWVVSAAGMFRTRDGETFVQASPAAVGDNETPTNIAFAAGEMWMGTASGRLMVYRHGRFEDSGFTGPKMWITPMMGAEPELWVSWADGSVGRISGTVLRKRIQIPRGYMTAAVHEFPDGRVAIGTLGGLYEWREGLLRDLIPRIKGRLHIVTGMKGEPAGALWATTTSGGLYRVKGGQTRQIGSAQGLPESILGLVDDERGFFWMCSLTGAVRVSKADLNAIADGRLERTAPVTFVAEDGMSDECNGGRAALFRGKLYFPTVAGVAVVDPARAELPPVPSLLRIVEARADGSTIQSGDSLPPGVESLEIDYASMSFRVPQRVRYTYQLLGYDASPVDAQNRRTAYYPRLPHGNYHFVVSAINEDGARNASPVGFDFSVAPRFHERTDARAGFVALGVGAVFAGVRLWTRALRRRQKDLERIVSERTRALAIEKERAEAANAAKTRFVSSVSHELRTPLNAILGFTDLLRGASGQRNRDEYLDIVKSSGAHLLTLVNSVLSLTEIEAGEQQSAKAPFAPRLLVREVVRMMTPRAEAKGLRLLEDLEVLPGWVSGDAARIRQILINLIGNAIKFTAKGHVTLHVSREDDRTTFAVEDSGPGIAPAEQAALFQEFSQTDAGVRSGEGTGLGLAISRRLATLMNGDLTLDESSENGSTFLLTLDLVEAEAPVAARTRRVFGLVKPAALAPVLVVDDSDLNRRLMRELHQRVGLGVIEAPNGPEGLRLFEENTPSMVWTDAQMPGYGGEELARRIRALEGSRGGTRTPMVAVTASALGDEREALRRAGCDDVILKPFEENLFFETLARHLKLELKWLERSPDQYPSGDGWVGGAASWDEDFEELRRAVGAAEWEAVRRTAHSLKGEASLRGRNDMAAEFGILEEQALGRCSDLPLRNALENVERLMRASKTAGP